MGAEGVKMATEIEVDGGPLQAQASPPPPLWLAAAAEKTAHKQISDAHRATELEEVAVRSMAEHSRNGAGGSRATVAELGNIVEMPCLLGCSATLDAHNIGMSIPVGNSLLEGTGHYTSLQELLLGFTSGALCLVSNQDGHLGQGLSYVETISYADERNVEYCNASCQVGKTEISLQQDYVETEEDIVHENSSDETSYAGNDADNDETDNEMEQTTTNAGSDADNEETDNEEFKETTNYAGNVIEPEEAATFFPNEKELDSVDWDRFYSTGELVKTKDSSGNATNADVQNGYLETTLTQNKEGWKKRRRDKIAPNIKHFRMPSGLGAVERAMRQFCDKKEGHIFEPRVGLEFDSEAEAIEFYNLYSWEVGFGIRRGNVDGNKDGYITVRDVVCQRQVIT
ncbi:uncharacterized protein [Miscanthus floridulus]|uniref:uncharacterized protein isoform X2 n=1 Tax=Miscanthus floridulus TaxID=154761 RepID=UPI00345985C8